MEGKIYLLLTFPRLFSDGTFSLKLLCHQVPLGPVVPRLHGSNRMCERNRMGLRATVKPVFCRRSIWYDNKIQELCSHSAAKDIRMSEVGPSSPTPYETTERSRHYVRHFLIIDTYPLMVSGTYLWINAQ
jgi:hypothetical protein